MLHWGGVEPVELAVTEADGTAPGPLQDVPEVMATLARRCRPASGSPNGSLPAEDAGAVPK